MKVWDINNGTLLHSLEGHTDGVSNLVLTSDNRLITSCGSQVDSLGGRTSSDHTIKVWDIIRGVLLYSLEEHTAGVSNLLFTSDNRLISSCRSNSTSNFDSSWHDRTVKVWDINNGTLLYSLEGHTEGVSNLILTADNRLISSCYSNLRGYSLHDHTVKVWDINNGTLLHSLEGHTAEVSNLLFAPNGRLITSCRGSYSFVDHTVKIWDIVNGTLLHSFEGQLPSLWMNLLHTSTHVLTAGEDRLNIWCIEVPEKVAQFTADGTIASCEVAPNGTIIVGDGLGHVHFLDLVEPA